MNGSYFLLTNLLSEDEKRVITGIAAHIERGEKRVGIQQIASENFLSAASIVKMCKRLGFDGYSELYYYLSRQMDRRGERSAENLKTLVDNYSDELCAYLRAKGAPAVSCDTAAEGVRRALEESGGETPVVACGSLYLMGEIREAVKSGG